jgi:triacylglycerol lipase
MLLRSHGVLAFAPNVVPYAAIEDRAKDWIRHIQFIIDQTKAQR